MNQSMCVSKLKVLADGTRLSVVKLLQSGPKTVSTLMQTLEVEQSLLSHHLRVLRDAQFVVMERAGKSVLYRLAPEVSGTANALDLDCCVLSFR